jgi:hypothetical protein
MKYIFALVTMIIVALILLPVILIRWSDDGLDDMVHGIKTLYGLYD